LITRSNYILNLNFRITAVFGDYYIGGRQFDRLETLISYYMYYSELKKGETLLNPVSPLLVRICFYFRLNFIESR
jgi:hypothetical protein